MLLANRGLGTAVDGFDVVKGGGAGVVVVVVVVDVVVVDVVRLAAVDRTGVEEEEGAVEDVPPVVRPLSELAAAVAEATVQEKNEKDIG